ncbi:hypothetical protein B0H14DRAFT_3677922 [Mycena olivaceomarginata]|nr:hypothetical protein B0H14DRAFT_3677922 [Mycena olivaceomarginata]
MRWEAAVIVPSPPNSLNINGGARDGGANNAGYAVLTFATAAGASRALAQLLLGVSLYDSFAGHPPRCVRISVSVFTCFVGSEWVFVDAGVLLGLALGLGAYPPQPCPASRAFLAHIHCLLRLRPIFGGFCICFGVFRILGVESYAVLREVVRGSFGGPEGQLLPRRADDDAQLGARVRAGVGAAGGRRCFLVPCLGAELQLSSGAGINSSSGHLFRRPFCTRGFERETRNGTGEAREPGANESGDAYPSSNTSGGGVLSPTSPLSPGIVNGGANGGFPGTAGANGYPKEYSIFMGDLAPETSNSDLVAVSCVLFCFLVWEGGGVGFSRGVDETSRGGPAWSSLSPYFAIALFSLLPRCSLPSPSSSSVLTHLRCTPLPPSFLPPRLATSPPSSLTPSLLLPHAASFLLPSSLCLPQPRPRTAQRRAPKFIRPFASCKSAKIMLDPVTGIIGRERMTLTDARRFTDEADQQHALIEMHGLYCLSRPSAPNLLPTSTSAPIAYPSTASLPTSVSDQPAGQQQQQQQSVSAPIAVPTSTPTGAYYPGADAGRERGGQEYINNNGGGQGVQ